MENEKKKEFNPRAFDFLDWLCNGLLLFLSDASQLSNSERKALDRPVHLFHRHLLLSYKVFYSLRNLGKDASCTQGRPAALMRVVTLATRLNSNYACMGLPPDDMIGF